MFKILWERGMIMRNLKKISSSFALGLMLGAFPIVGAADNNIALEKTKLISENKASNQKSLEGSAIDSSLEAKIKEILLKSKDLTISDEDLAKENSELKKKIDKLENENFKLNSKITELSMENVNLKASADAYKKRAHRYKRKLNEKKDYVSPEVMQAEVDKVRTQMILDFNGYLSDYIKKNPSRKMKNIDLRGLFTQFINFNVNYTANGDTTVAPLAVKGVAKGTVAGAAITS